MKNYILIVSILFLLAACDTKTSDSVPIPEDSLPFGSETTTYPDDPDMVLVTVKNTQGVKSAEGNYYQGVRHGSWTEYYPNGIIRELSTYNLGIREGALLTFENTGQLVSSSNYHNGKLSGAAYEFTRSKVTSHKNYVEGNLEGIVRIYYPSGQIMEESNYANGQRNGKSLWFDMDGNVTIEYDYEDGKLMSK